MRVVSSVFITALPVLVSAGHDFYDARRHVYHARQAGVAGGVAATTPAGAATTTVASFSVSLLSVNPTAVPLASIVSGTANNPPTPTLATTFTPGATPPSIPNAPPLPNAALLKPASYPPLDKTPPTDSPEVQQWIKDVANTGIKIPDFAPTVDGGCGANAQAAADATRCWWSCTGCIRSTDIDACPEQRTWGLTYDDASPAILGPAPYTPNLLNFLTEQKVQATFFVVGSRVISYPAMLQTEYMLGHQIAAHTWGHQSLTQLTNDQVIAQLGWSKKVVKDVIGVTPLHFRPPFGDIDDRVRAIALAMQLTPIMWTRINATATFDTDDFDINGGLSTSNQVLHNWQNILTNVTQRSNGFIVLEHDLFPQAVDVATGYILPDALAHTPKLTIEPIIKCLAKTPGDAYLETNDNATNPIPSGTLGDVGAAGTGGVPGAAQASGSGGSGGKNSAPAVFVGVNTLGLATALAGLAFGAASVLL